MLDVVALQYARIAHSRKDLGMIVSGTRKGGWRLIPLPKIPLPLPTFPSFIFALVVACHAAVLSFFMAEIVFLIFIMARGHGQNAVHVKYFEVQTFEPRKRNEAGPYLKMDNG